MFKYICIFVCVNRCHSTYTHMYTAYMDGNKKCIHAWVYLRLESKFNCMNRLDYKKEFVAEDLVETFPKDQCHDLKDASKAQSVSQNNNQISLSIHISLLLSPCLWKGIKVND